MKNNKGITLTSLMIYVIGMLIVVGIISTLTTFFYKNIDISDINSDTTTQYTKFTSVFSKEINTNGNKVIDTNTDNSQIGKKVSYIIFSSGNQYTFMQENNSIYKNNVKICENIDDCEFSWVYQNSSYVVNVSIKTGNIDRTGADAVKYTIK